eukprot:1791943-Amphidinium_carterae.1
MGHKKQQRPAFCTQGLIGLSMLGFFTAGLAGNSVRDVFGVNFGSWGLKGGLTKGGFVPSRSVQGILRGSSRTSKRMLNWAVNITTFPVIHSGTARHMPLLHNLPPSTNPTPRSP